MVSTNRFTLLEDRDRFAEECAADAYGESFFPLETATASNGKREAIPPRPLLLIA